MHDELRLEAAVAVSPLTVLVRGVLEWALPAGTFARLQAEHAPEQRTRRLTVDALAWMMVEVVSGSRPSVHAAFVADQQRDEPTLPASAAALYGKLGRLAPAFSTAAVRGSADRLGALLAEADRSRCPGWSAYRVRVLDGTDLGGTEHRLGVLRGLRAAGLPGRFVVEYDLATGLVVDAVASADAYASERTLAAAVLARAQAQDLFVADRHFCTAAWMCGLVLRRAHFVVREYSKLRCRDVGPQRRVGRGDGGVLWEQAVEVEDPRTGWRRRLRRVVIRLDQPTRRGEAEVRLLTNLPARHGARKVAALYRRRWTLERHFDFLKNCLHGEVEGLGQPRAAIFAMCMALVAGNAVAVLRQALGAAHGEAVRDELSGYYLADEVAANYRAVDRLVPPATWEARCRQEPKAFWRWCQHLAGAVQVGGLKRRPRGPKKPRPKRASGKHRHHYSTYRLLAEANRLC